MAMIVAMIKQRGILVMTIIKAGDSSKAKKGEFFFHCKNCGCEWYANRGDEGLKISPPCFEFFTYMKCPNCKKVVYDR